MTGYHAKLNLTDRIYMYFCCILIQENKTWHKVLETLY